MAHKIGDRVAFITNAEVTGTIVSDVYDSPLGGPRQMVKWDKSGNTVDWNPEFLLPINSTVKPKKVFCLSGMCFIRGRGLFRRSVFDPHKMDLVFEDKDN